MQVKGVIVAAGYGTRFLPATKTVPKEMLPLLDRPAIDFIVRELVAAGIDNVLVITSRRKRALEDYFDREIELEWTFATEGADAKLAKIAPPPCNVVFVRQQRMLGTGHALLLAREFVGDSPCVVAYPDDLHFGDQPLAAQLIEAYQRTGCSVLATVFDPPHLEQLGVVAPAADGMHVADLVEKPAPGTEPSRHASVGRFLYTPEIFELLAAEWEAHQRDRAGGELWHTGAVVQLAKAGKVVFHQLRGQRVDIGTPQGYLHALLTYAETVPEAAQVLAEWRAGNGAAGS